jgi:hypothetical protein
MLKHFRSLVELYDTPTVWPSPILENTSTDSSTTKERVEEIGREGGEGRRRRRREEGKDSTYKGSLNDFITSQAASMGNPGRPKKEVSTNEHVAPHTI